MGMSSPCAAAGGICAIPSAYSGMPSARWTMRSMARRGRDRTERDARHVGVEEMPEAVAAAVLAGGVVGMGERIHEDHALVLREILLRHGHRRGGAAGEHDRAVTLDSALRRLAGGVRVRLGIAADEIGRAHV